jgi:hypothetical protein
MINLEDLHPGYRSLKSKFPEYLSDEEVQLHTSEYISGGAEHASEMTGIPLERIRKYHKASFEEDLRSFRARKARKPVQQSLDGI